MEPLPFTLGARLTVQYVCAIKIIARSIVVCAALAGAVAFGEVPPLNVWVFTPGRTHYGGRTDENGAFATAKLAPGNYFVQFTSRSESVRGKVFTVVIAAGQKKVSAANVVGEKFGAGFTMNVDVGADLNITGQVAIQTAPTSTKSSN